MTSAWIDHEGLVHATRVHQNKWGNTWKKTLCNLLARRDSGRHLKHGVPTCLWCAASTRTKT